MVAFPKKDFFRGLKLGKAALTEKHEPIDALIAKIVELGGTVLEPAADTPYGRLAKAADPTGATFKLTDNSGS